MAMIMGVILFLPFVLIDGGYFIYYSIWSSNEGDAYDRMVYSYADKSFTFVIKTPPAAVQLKEAAKLKSGSAEPNRRKVASVTWEQVRAIAEDKMPDLNCFTIESAMKLIAGTARSMGITVTGEFPASK